MADARLKALKAKADPLFVPHAIALRKLEMAIVDADRLATTPGLVAAVSRDLEFLCTLAEDRYAPLRDVPWLRTHRRNVEALRRHLLTVTEGELPLTDFMAVRPSGSMRARS